MQEQNTPNMPPLSSGNGKYKPTGFVKYHRTWLRDPAHRRLSLATCECLCRLYCVARAIGELRGCLVGRNNRPMSVRQMSRETNVSVSTMLRAVKDLTHEGFLELREVNGTTYTALSDWQHERTFLQNEHDAMTAADPEEQFRTRLRNS